MMRLPARFALIALTLPAALSLAGTAIAQSPSMAPPAAVPPPPPPPAGDEQMGGSMTLAQFQARQESRIMAADTDGDGRISLAEWTAAMSGRRGGGGGGHGGGYDPSRMFERMDANHDGVLDKGEIDAAAAERFQRMDSNGDGIVTADERAAQRGGGRQGGGRQGDAPGAAGNGAPPTTPQP